MNWQENIKRNGKCCACEGSLTESQCVNMVDLFKVAMWEFPVAGNVNIPDDPKHAVAVLCGDCAEAEKPAKFAIETREEGSRILYYPVADLGPIPSIVREQYDAMYARLESHCTASARAEMN